MLVTNDDVVLKVTSQGAELNPSGLNGWMLWVRRITIEHEEEDEAEDDRRLARSPSSPARAAGRRASTR